jgi:hypothetical protein
MCEIDRNSLSKLDKLFPIPIFCIDYVQNIVKELPKSIYTKATFKNILKNYFGGKLL